VPTKATGLPVVRDPYPLRKVIPMKTNIAPPRPTTLSGRATHPSRHRPPLQAPQGAPCCSLNARPAPAPSWEELLGQR